MVVAGLASPFGFRPCRRLRPLRPCRDGIQLALQAVNDAEQMRLIADKPGLLIRLGQVCLIGRQLEKALTVANQAMEMAVGQEAKGDEAWARFLIGRAYWASAPKEFERSEQQIDMALRLASACEARPLAAFCKTTLSGIHAERGDHARAKEFESAATAMYKEFGMQPLPLNPS